MHVLITSIFQYLSGFGGEYSSEDPRCPGSLPVGQVSSYIKMSLFVIISVFCQLCICSYLKHDKTIFICGGLVSVL